MLKELLGTLYTDEIAQALEGKELVLKSEQENMIPKSRFDEVNNAKKDLAKQVKEFQTSIEELTKGNSDIEVIKQKLTDKTKEFEDFQLDIETKETNNKKVSAIINDLTSMKALNPKLLAKEFNLDQVSFDDNGKLVGVKDTFERLKTEYAQQFGKETIETPKPGEGGGDGITKEAFKKMSYKEKAELFETNKDVYDSFTK